MSDWGDKLSENTTQKMAFTWYEDTFIKYKYLQVIATTYYNGRNVSH